MVNSQQANDMIRKFILESKPDVAPPIWWRGVDMNEIPDYVLNREIGSETVSITKNGITVTIKTPSKSKTYNRQGDKFYTIGDVTKRMGYWMDYPEDEWKLSDEEYYKLPLKKRLSLECNQQFKYKIKNQFENSNNIVDMNNYTIDDSINENSDIPKYKLIGGTVFQKWIKFENPLTKDELSIVIKNITGVDEIDVKEAQGLKDRYVIFAKNQGCIGYYFIAKQTLHIDKTMLNKP